MGVVCRYKFDSSIYADLLPGFNSEFTEYTVGDVTDDEGYIIRTIESESLPTLMRFGQIWVDSDTDTANADRCNSLLEVLAMDTSALTNCVSMFRICRNLTSIECEWNTSNVTNIGSMFESCTSLTSLDVSAWDTSSVSYMYYIFNNCNALTSLDLSNFNTSSVIDMSYMFCNCNNLTSLDLSNWNTSNVTTMYSMFYNCQLLTSLDVSNWNTNNVTNMSYMFYNCKSLTELDLSNFNTSKVTNMRSMFQYCTNLTSLDVSNFNTSKVTNMHAMFNNCSSLTSLDASNFDTSKVTRMDYMFNYCSSLTSLDVSNFDTSKVTNMYAMFANISSLTTLDISNFDLTNVTTVSRMFKSMTNLKYLNLNNIEFTATDYDEIFLESTNLEVIECNKISTLNKIGTLTEATIYVDDTVDQSEYIGTTPLKIYQEEKIEIKLNSPLLQGDTIEVVDSKICHVHRMGMVTLDGSEDEGWGLNNTFYFTINIRNIKKSNKQDMILCDTLQPTVNITANTPEIIGIYIVGLLTQIRIRIDSINSNPTQWLSENPTTVVYELETPYYEDITPLQSSIVLKTFLEANMNIETDLPIDVNMSYRTNIPSVSTLSARATELENSENVIVNLSSLIDEEIE